MGKYMIEIDNVTKRYILGQIGGTTLHEEIQRRRAKRLGKEDPTKKIGAKDYRDGEEFWALGGVSFKVKKGERVGIIGHNGAGKSTLLKLLSRVTAPTTGEIWLDGRVTSMLEVGTGFNGELTGRENIYMNGAILGMTKKEIDRKIDDIIEFSECGQFIDTPVKRYSSGMYVKLAFSVAAHLDSEIMIMDEVLAVGDMAFQKKCLDKMNDVSRNEGRTILYVSHNMSTIRQLCDRCVVLDHGKLAFDGDVEEAIRLYLKKDDSDALSIDYSDIPRQAYLRNTKVRTLFAEYINKEDCLFGATEPMKVHLVWENEDRIRNLCLRLEIFKTDRTPVGTALLEHFYNGEKGERGEVTVSMDISSISPGRYGTYYTFYTRDEYGNNLDVDCVQGMFFEKGNWDGGISWNAVCWGNVRLPGLTVEQ